MQETARLFFEAIASMLIIFMVAALGAIKFREIVLAFREKLPHKRCNCAHKLTDRDLPPIARTEANCWKALYFEARLELVRANKGIRRIRGGYDKLTERMNRLRNAQLILPEKWDEIVKDSFGDEEK